MLKLLLLQLKYLMQYKGIKGLYHLNNSFLAALHTKEDSINCIYIIDMYNFIELSSCKEERQGINWIDGFVNRGVFLQYADSLGCHLIPFEELLSNRTLNISGNQTWNDNLERYIDYIKYLIQLYKTFNMIDETCSINASMSTRGDYEFLIDTLQIINQLIKNQEMNYPEGILSNAKVTSN